ncbi:MAG: hypothetical protein HKM06_04260 [Spirochaetales bacterium]|nr:hypothetical protein [Spirochaetales bacterium]
MAIVIGAVLLLLSVWTVLPLPFPLGLNWGQQVLAVLEGAIPLLLIFVGLIAIFIGIADVKDRMEAKKEEAAEKARTSGDSQNK